MTADPTMRTHCDDCARRALCDIIKRGTAAAPDPRPPEDHAAFVEARASGLRAMKEALASRRAPDQAEGPQPDDVAELRALADKFERETQVFLGYRNAERAVLLRHTADELARLRAREIL